MNQKRHRNVSGFASAILSTALIPALFAQSGSGRISGVVVGDDGKLLTAIVTANRIGAPAWSVRAESAADGSFSFSLLPAGAYELCAAVKGDTYLDPCVWAASIPSVKVDTQAVSGYRLVVKKGVTLTVRLNDPRQVLDAVALPGKTVPHVIVGVFTDRHLFQTFGVSGKDTLGRSHQGTIPADRNVALHLFGRDVDVTDLTGKPIDVNGSTVTIQPRLTNAAQLPLVFNVSPKKP